MARKSPSRKSPRKPAGKSGRKPARKAARSPTRSSARRPARQRSARGKGAAKRAGPGAGASRKVRPGFISHTELASSDPAATKAWAQKVLGWSFGDAMPMPDGSQYHMWDFGHQMGGGIRASNPAEAPGAIPYCEVPDIQAAFDRAVRAGGTPMMPPTAIPGSGGWIAIVQAPGGPAIGLWGQG
jgi:uncharacterized protein